MSASPPIPAAPNRKKKSNRRRLQFSLRTLILATLLAAVFFSWLAVQIGKVKDEERAVAAIRAMGGSVHYRHELEPTAGGQPGEPPGPEWLRRLLGQDFFAQVWAVSYAGGATDADLEHLDAIRHLRHLRHLGIGLSATSPAGRARIRGCRELSYLGLQATSVGDEEIAQLADHTGLEIVRLAHTAVTDRGVEILGQLPALVICELEGTLVSDSRIEWDLRLRRKLSPSPAPAPTGPTPARATGLQNLTILGLPGAQITDAGLVHIGKLRNLEWLDLQNTKITEAGLIHLEHLKALRTVRANGTDLSPELQEALWSHGSRFREAME